MKELQPNDRSSPDNKKQLRADQGFILVLVLWAAVLLSLLAAGFAASVRSHIRATASALESARSEAIANGGINLALLDLIVSRQASRGEARFPANGRNVSCQAAQNALLIVRIDDEAGKVNINLASKGLLTSLFSGLGASTSLATNYANRIVTYRGGGGENAANEERAEYISAGRPLGPKNAPFDTVDELDQVLGLPQDLMVQLKPLVTVHSGIANIDQTRAAPGLIEILDAASLGTAAGGLAAGVPALGTTPSPVTPGRSNGRAFTISALARMPSGVQYVAQAIVEFPPRPAARYDLRQWRQGSASVFDPAPGSGTTALPPC